MNSITDIVSSEKQRIIFIKINGLEYGFKKKASETRGRNDGIVVNVYASVHLNCLQ